MTGIDTSINTVQPAAAQKVAAAATSGADEGFSFGDFLDIINPLQHIPVVSSIYRALTGDTIDEGEKIAGDTLYGGVMGFASSLADAMFKEVTGDYFGDTMLALVTGSGGDETRLAEADEDTSWVADGPPRALGPDTLQAVAAYEKTARATEKVMTIN